jgi:hypothetical protein
MKITRIQYTVRSDFAEQNKQNIANVMQELGSLNHPGIRYSAYVLDDGKSFMHFVVFTDEEAGKNVINSLASFKRFQSDLKASNPEVPPKFEDLALVGSSYKFFD